ncbi:MAG: F0F1 ATP synthase subunit A [bacterium]
MNFIEIIEHHVLDHPVITFTVKNIQLSITKHLVMMFIAGLLMAILFGLIPRFNNNISRKFRILLEMFILFVRDEILVPVLGDLGRKFTPYFLTLFFFILFCNLLGMVPFGATATGNISVTGGLAVSSLVLIVYCGVKYQGLFSYIKNFVPAGVPWWIVPVLLPIEVFGLFTKAFALCIRLFANMIAGHIVILAFIGLIFLFGSVIIAPISVITDIALSLLEIFIAFLQAYIFTLLTAIFLGASVKPEH